MADQRKIQGMRPAGYLYDEMVDFLAVPPDPSVPTMAEMDAMITRARETQRRNLGPSHDEWLAQFRQEAARYLASAQPVAKEPEVTWLDVEKVYDLHSLDAIQRQIFGTYGISPAQVSVQPRTYQARKARRKKREQ